MSDNEHLTFAAIAFFTIFISPITAMVVAVIWWLFAILVDDYNPGDHNE